MSQMRPVPAAAARGVHTSWRALSAAEAAAAALLDVLAVLLPAVAVGLGLGSGPLAWIVALEVLVLLVLMEARSGRTPGLLAVSATSCAPARGSAPDLGRAAARAALRPLLPFTRRAVSGVGAGVSGEDVYLGIRWSVLDLLTGTVTLTSRPAPGTTRRGGTRLARRPAASGFPDSAGTPAPSAVPSPFALPAPPVLSAASVLPTPSTAPTATVQVPAVSPPVPPAPPPVPPAPAGAVVSSDLPTPEEAVSAATVPVQPRRAPRHRAATPAEAP
ncbi:hypothetical protein [Actinomyces wuliandei]|uniref:hypothetical protein n=1 Tax=Actinomyces wuliandei TaxID=2057743 RepID=UPI000FD88E82|nr:hypothetical protein [Actinomyces wuliandei]